MLYTLRSRLIASLIGVSFLVGAVSLVVGGQLLERSVLSEATNRVSLNLNAAREIFQTRIRLMEVALKTTNLGFGFLASLEGRDVTDLIQRLDRMGGLAGLDFAGLADVTGRTFCRIGPNAFSGGGDASENPIVRVALERQTAVSGAVVLGRDFLRQENPTLAEKARIPMAGGPEEAGKGGDHEVTSGLALMGAVPAVKDGKLIGVLYGGVLLNRDQSIVDKVKDTVFRNEQHNGREVGRASIFLDDVRVATNVPARNGGRAFGTRIAEEVKAHVLEKGERWTHRALVTSDSHITAYEPIEDIWGRRVGIIGVGVLEEKYMAMQRKTLSVFIVITLAGMALAAVLGYLVANNLMKPVRQLIRASQQVTEGSLTPEIGPISEDEIGVLQKTFREMVAAMGRRRAESQNRLIMSEKQASVGRLAAGVAHEINNPLTGVLTYTHMLLRRKDLTEDVRTDLETIAQATERVRTIVKGLLDFSRQTRPDRELTDVNKLVGGTIALMENQALVKGVGVAFDKGEELRKVNMDRNQFQSVILNVLLNALDASKSGDSISIRTRNSESVNEAGQEGIEIEVADTGSGISQDHLNKLFDPFFTTKEVGKGTGLGLAVSLGIVQRHGGTIRVQSSVGQGSTFSIWVPLEGRAI